MKKYLEQGGNKPEIRLDQLTGTRSSLMRDINYGDQMPRGAKGFMRGIIGALEKDIAKSGNKEFYNEPCITIWDRSEQIQYVIWETYVDDATMGNPWVTFNPSYFNKNALHFQFFFLI